VQHLNGLAAGNVKQGEVGKKFEFEKKKQVTYIGQSDGIVEGENRIMSGQQAWVSWRVESYAWTRTWRVRVGILVTMVMNAVFGRDITRL
jgi:NADH dehydrogenase FAD-containing subunit